MENLWNSLFFPKFERGVKIVECSGNNFFKELAMHQVKFSYVGFFSVLLEKFSFPVLLVKFTFYKTLGEVLKCCL